MVLVNKRACGMANNPHSSNIYIPEPWVVNNNNDHSVMHYAMNL